MAARETLEYISFMAVDPAFQLSHYRVLRNSILDRYELSTLFARSYHCDLQFESADGRDQLVIQRCADTWLMHFKAHNEPAFEVECVRECIATTLEPETALAFDFERMTNSILNGRLRFASFDARPDNEFENRVEERLAWLYRKARADSFR